MSSLRSVLTQTCSVLHWLRLVVVLYALYVSYSVSEALAASRVPVRIARTHLPLYACVPTLL